MDSSGYSSPDIHRRIGPAASAMRRLHRVCSNRRLRLSSNFRVYNACVLHVLLYDSETCTLLKEDGKKLQTFHMRCQGQLLEVRWIDFVTNVTVSECTSLSDIRDIVAGRRHSLFGDISRFPAHVSANMVLKQSVDVRSGTKSSSDWTRLQDRPRNTWVKQLVAESGMAAVELW